MGSPGSWGGGPLFFTRFEALDSGILGENFHLLDGDVIEFTEPVRLGEILLDEERVQVFQIGETDKLGDVGVVTDVAFVAGVGIAPRLCGDAEKGHVENIGLGGVDQIDLAGSKSWGDQILFDGIGMDAVVDFGEVATDVPAELLTLDILQALELFDQIKLKFDRYPGGEFKGNVFVGVGAAITAGFGDDAGRTGLLDPLTRGECEAV